MAGFPAIRRQARSPRLAFAVWFFGGIVTPGLAQPTIRPAGESFLLERDATAARRLADVREYVRKQRWEQAADLLARLPAERGRSLVVVRRGWYVNVAHYCHLLASSLPAKGLQAYRKKVDVRANTWLRDGLRTRNAGLLRRVVREAFCSSSGDAALMTLGQWAWNRGDVDGARRWWRMLLPREKDSPGINVLSYPGSDFKAAEIRARLILCDLMQGRRKRADAALVTFAKQHPAAKGTIAGRKGVLRQILKDVRTRSLGWPPLTNGKALHTFAAGPTRNGAATGAVDVGGLLWSRRLPWRRLPLGNGKKPKRWESNPACFPVVTNGNVYVADAHRVFGYRLSDGSPAFPVEADGKRTPEVRAVLYSDLALGNAPRPTEPCTGVPRFTLTVADGRLYARLGSPVTGRAQTELRAVRSRLVCLDLKRGEGRLAWKVESQTLGAGWEFEGAPLVEDGRLYCVMRRRRLETEIHVGCFDAARGKLLWSRRLGTAIAGGAEGENTVSHLLPTLAEGRLFVSTNLGAIVAIDAGDGFIDWAVTYATRSDGDRKSRSDPRTRGFAPCLFHDGMVYAAPGDSDRLLAIDARTGAPQWQRRLRGGVRHLLGVRSGSLVVSGNRLWGLNPADGKVRWNRGFENPDAYGFGRGIIAGARVYWPLPKEVLVVDVLSGRLLRRIAIAKLHAGRGGNLSIVQGRLVIAEPDRLAVYGERPPNSKRKAAPAVSATGSGLR